MEFYSSAQITEQAINDSELIYEFQLKLEEMYKNDKSGLASFELLNQQLSSRKSLQWKPDEVLLKQDLDGPALYKQAAKASLVFGKLATRKDKPGKFYLFLASSFAVGSDGICITNYHVIHEIPSSENTYTFVAAAVMNYKGEVYPVTEVLASSKKNDLAIFKVGGIDKGLDIFPLRRKVLVGEDIATISHPFNHLRVMLYNYTSGIVNRLSTSEKKELRMNISAEYAPGSSGGAIFDNRGNLVGVISTLFLMQDSKKQTLMLVKEAIPVQALWELFQTEE